MQTSRSQLGVLTRIAYEISRSATAAKLSPMIFGRPVVPDDKISRQTLFLFCVGASLGIAKSTFLSSNQEFSMTMVFTDHFASGVFVRTASTTRSSTNSACDTSSEIDVIPDR